MKILVCSKKEMQEQWLNNKSIFINKSNYFISIAGLADKLDWAYPYIGENVLKLKFDDVTEFYVNDCNLQNGVDIILFEQNHAKQIKEFVDKIPKDCTLYVNCAAGISRSGAVGYCINEYINNDNKEDFEFFEQENKHIQPNPYVKRLLKKELFGEKNYAEIFKNIL